MNLETLNPEARKYLQEILDKGPYELDRPEREFLRARASYLKDNQLDEFSDILNSTEEPETPEEKEQKESDNTTHQELMAKARSLGYRGKIMNRVEVLKYIEENTPKT